MPELPNGPATADLARRLRAAPPIEQRLPCEVAFYVLAYLQLAMRHPAAESASGRVVREAATQLGDALVARLPDLAPLVAAGWDTLEDA